MENSGPICGTGPKFSNLSTALFVIFLILFTRLNNIRLSNGSQDISVFLSFKLNNDTWSDPVNLKKYISFKGIANCPVVSPDGKYLFFLDVNGSKYSPYWISTGFIKDLKPESIK